LKSSGKILAGSITNIFEGGKKQLSKKETPKSVSTRKKKIMEKKRFINKTSEK